MCFKIFSVFIVPICCAMNIAEEKARLKQEIDNVNDPEVLHRISALLSNDNGSLMTEEQLAIVM